MELEYLQVHYDGNEYFGREKHWYLLLDGDIRSEVLNEPKIRALDSIYHMKLARAALSEAQLTKTGGTKQ